MDKHPKMIAAAIVRRIKDHISQLDEFIDGWEGLSDEEEAQILETWYGIALEELSK